MKIDPDTAKLGHERATSISTMSAELLRKLFLHHDGIVVGATLAALEQGGVLEVLFRERGLRMRELLERLPGEASRIKKGYLHVALRCLALQGWLKRRGVPASDDLLFEVTPKGAIAFSLFDRYFKVAEFIYSGVPLDYYLFGPGFDDHQGLDRFYALIHDCMNHWGLPKAQGDGLESQIFETACHHLDGMLIGPLMIAAKMHGLFDEGGLRLEKLGSPRLPVEKSLELLEYFGWLKRGVPHWQFSELGRLASEFSLHYGLTWSYAPMFCNLPRLIFNHGKNVTHVEFGQEERHVDRVINVLASGVAHRRYFEDSEKIILELFNRVPLDEQPKFVADMGCGDGEWLKSIYRVVQTRTLRGKHLDRFPLLMIGADYNLKAREVVARKLAQAQVPNIVLFGDVGDPKRFAEDLKERGIDIRDGLHVRAFIDHNRPYRKPDDRSLAFEIMSTGAYADEEGEPIPNRDLELSLREHLAKWVPYIQKHGLIILEAHHVEPEIASTLLGKTHATAFDTYHGYSNQYPVDFEAFIRQAEGAGLRSVIHRQMLYPSRLPFVAISLNHFKTHSISQCQFAHGDDATRCARFEWEPAGNEDFEDGQALHELLYQDGDTSLARRWCAYATGLLVAELLAAIEHRLARIIESGAKSASLTVVDYGAGTGFATLELIKGLEENGLLRQFNEANVEFRLALCDFPSGWFAKAFELLRAFPFVSFHSLRDPYSGKVRMLDEIFPANSVDIVYASMVFHLVPPVVLSSISESFASVLKSQGVLLWNTPDTAPTLTHSELIHAGNRMLRARLKQLLEGEVNLAILSQSLPEELQPEMRRIVGEFERLRGELDPKRIEAAWARAEKQILPQPTHASLIRTAFGRNFSCKTWVKLANMSDDELLALALLPANQRNAGVIQDRKLRETILTWLVKYDVLPRIHASPAGIASGMILHWTFGRHVKIDSKPAGPL